MMCAFAKRNILLYFRDKTAVFFSLLSVIILFALYILFLGDMTSKNLPDFPTKKPLLLSWFFSGVLAITALTTTLGALGNLVEDRANKIDLDFKSSPIKNSSLVSGYILSALFIGFLMCTLTFIAIDIYLVISEGTILPFGKTIQLSGIIGLSVLANGAMVLFLVSFFRTSNAFAAASMIIGTLIGFLAGIYIPIGGLPEYLQNIVKLFPISHSVALFRQVLMETQLNEAFTTAPAEIKENFQLDMGMIYEIFDWKTTKLFSALYLIFTAVLFFMLSSLSLTRKRK